MATNQNLNSDARYCRDCGGPATRFEGISTCNNTTTRGSQKDSKDHCQNLSWNNRQFCEHCSNPTNDFKCQGCGVDATRP